MDNKTTTSNFVNFLTSRGEEVSVSFPEEGISRKMFSCEKASKTPRIPTPTCEAVVGQSPKTNNCAAVVRTDTPKCTKELTGVVIGKSDMKKKPQTSPGGANGLHTVGVGIRLFPVEHVTGATRVKRVKQPEPESDTADLNTPLYNHGGCVPPCKPVSKFEILPVAEPVGENDDTSTTATTPLHWLVLVHVVGHLIPIFALHPPHFGFAVYHVCIFLNFVIWTRRNE
jgi:hypothetical protein